MRGEFLRDNLHQHQLPALARAVAAAVRPGHLLHPAAREQDHAPALLPTSRVLHHQPRRLLSHAEAAREIDLQRAVPRFLGEFEEWLVGHRTGIGDGDIDLAEPGSGLPDRLRHGRRRGHVAAHIMRRIRTQLFRRGLAGLERQKVAQHDPRARREEPGGHRTTDVATATGNEHAFASNAFHKIRELNSEVGRKEAQKAQKIRELIAIGGLGFLCASCASLWLTSRNRQSIRRDRHLAA